ncbi:MAG TPA: hypothetical protein VFL29_05480 [Candidatus Dormibacteraeota bacterium]|nr:hypothetical protein [Candidatus Dormibacteraeota bacterium]
MDRIGSLRWRLRTFWYGVLALFGWTGYRPFAPIVAFRRDKAPVREGSPPRPNWSGPPDDEIGVAVPARMVLASQPRLIIAFTDCVAYSNGFTFGIAMRSKDPIRTGFGPHEPDEKAGFNIGIRYSDGRDSRRPGFGPSPELMNYFQEWSEGKDPPEPQGPVIGPMSGSASDTRWDYHYFVWPLPPDGPITITCRWPARGLHAAGKELNGTAIRAAGLKSKSVWS